MIIILQGHDYHPTRLVNLLPGGSKDVHGAAAWLLHDQPARASVVCCPKFHCDGVASQALGEQRTDISNLLEVLVKETERRETAEEACKASPLPIMQTSLPQLCLPFAADEFLCACTSIHHNSPFTLTNLLSWRDAAGA